MPFRRSTRKTNARSFRVKKRSPFKRRSTFKRGSALKTTTRGVAGTVYNSYRKPRTSLRKVKSKVSKELWAIKNTANQTCLPIQYGQNVNNVGNNGFAQIQVIGQAYDAEDIEAVINAVTFTSIAVSNTPRKLVFDGFRGQYTMKNNTNSDVELDLYWCLARRDIASQTTPINSFQNGVQYADITQVLLDGAKEQGLTLTNITWPLSLTPFQITRFCEFFKILKSQRILLGGGRNVTVKMNLPKKFMFATDLVVGTQQGDVAQSYACFANKTITLLAISRGEVINDATSHTPVSTAGSAYLLLGEESYTAYPNNIIPAQLVAPTALGTVTTHMVLTQETELSTAPVQT